jgi:hypothetical protein
MNPLIQAKYFILTCIVIFLDLVFGTLGWIYEISLSSFQAGREAANSFPEELNNHIWPSGN